VCRGDGWGIECRFMGREGVGRGNARSAAWREVVRFKYFIGVF
jgi:hypothetical protein